MYLLREELVQCGAFIQLQIGQSHLWRKVLAPCHRPRSMTLWTIGGGGGVDAPDVGFGPEPPLEESSGTLPQTEEHDTVDSDTVSNEGSHAHQQETTVPARATSGPLPQTEERDTVDSDTVSNEGSHAHQQETTVPSTARVHLQKMTWPPSWQAS
ncbi:UNVERIFIED_CONTAM: hypothetical protein FKN15_077681 [Acipenser sinensis]